ncbi:tRNA pseudouridine synthase-like 1 isoform X2 [Carettochelys insculpta]|uniref:tRNA pseudouridine synthase-like 1 isoform X2 n=1 Tax=Carettochelys insculpta TaxID=44489 RepID=UPI003EB78C09
MKIPPERGVAWRPTQARAASSSSGVMQTLTAQPVVGVLNYVEQAAQKLKPITPIKIYVSSRTDSGVHALCNSAHFDVQRAEGKPPFPERVIVSALNNHLKDEPIRILSAHRVSDKFHARFSARSRTYIYRLVTGCPRSTLPVFERDLCWAARGDHLNVPAVQEAVGFLLGTHDFSTFCSVSSETPFKSPIKTLGRADIRPSSGFMSHHYEYRLRLLLVHPSQQALRKKLCADGTGY